MSDATVDGLLVKVRGGPALGLGAMRALGAAEPILEVPAGTPSAFGATAAEPSVWMRADAGDNAWDRAHGLLGEGYAADGAGILAAEPDFAQTWEAPPAPTKQGCRAEPQSGEGGRAIGPQPAWHLGEKYSGLAAAREAVGDDKQKLVTIAHLDTGYDPDHAACPRNIWTEKQVNFTGEGDSGSAVDRIPDGGLLRNRGHGPGTIGILAGGTATLSDGGAILLGGAPGVRVLPVRIGDSVVRFSTSSMVKGFAYALENGVDVLSMSMGGLASSALADAVNRCYEAGIVMVTAAGNFLPRVPSPRSIVYPARMRRVLAATGVMADGSPYSGPRMRAMQGCHGPGSKMETAIAGWTPNIPWPELGCTDTIDEDGQGTSAATPQVAAAAALWIAHYHSELRYPEGWMRGEAARQALMRSAWKTTPKLDAKQVLEVLGAGALNALRALEHAPLPASELRRQPVASAAWDWLRLATGRGVGVTETVASPRERMLDLEILQLAGRDPALAALAGDAEARAPAPKARRQFLEAVRDSGRGSKALRGAIDRALGVRRAGTPLKAGPPPPSDAAPAVQAPPAAGDGKRRPPPPKYRRLRIFALDPSLGGSLAYVDAKEATVTVRYERDRNGNSLLLPGPVGEYIEVVDVDPASDQFYPPVDLDDHRLLLQDGLAPSEGNPKFHQQMVYAVAMRTIESFEDALGRKALWAEHRRPSDAPGGPGYEYVPRLRIYPHALRAKNAYYSPARGALLFGYFPAESQVGDSTVPGTLVFGCLSADIIAHEMTHALLDGYTPGYKERSNADVGAFHEGFADIVALFQHFQYRDLVRRQVATARGDLGAATLLGGLARQFGEGVNKRGPLRDYLRPTGEWSSYAETTEVHDRGSLLVAAIYKAFIAIFERRTGDLIRLATGGSGILSAGAIHPDLVDRLTDEACKAASHVLRMCIRALDYLPPVDVTFGAYLRAIITADLEQVDEDRYAYRTAFIESFRHFGLLPTNLRTMSVETLQLSAASDPQPEWLEPAIEALDIDWRHSHTRWQIYQRQRRRARDLHGILEAYIVKGGEAAAAKLGLQLGIPKFDPETGEVLKEARPRSTTFEVRNVRAAQRVRPDGTVSEQIIVVLAQRRAEPLDGKDLENGFFWFRGGATLVISPRNDDRKPEISYFIWKWLNDEERLERERRHRGFPADKTLRALYFGDRGIAGAEPFAALHMTDY
jgi:Subtilase family